MPSRGVAICTAVAAVAVLAMRCALGPFQLPGIRVDVNSPFFAETAFWLAILALLLFGSQSGVAMRTNEGTAPFPNLHLTAALCVIALVFAHNLADPFLSDDYIMLNVPPFHWSTFIAELHRSVGDGSFRPLRTIYYQLMRTAAGVNPVKWHLAGLALHLVNCTLVFTIAWRLWRDKATATVAGLVFGLNGTRPEAALWTAGNSDLLACACVLGSISLALSEHPERRRLRLALSLLLVAIGILFKESAYAMPLIAASLMLTKPNDSGRQQFSFYVIGSTSICAALLAWRWLLFHGPGGYINHATGQPAILSLHPLTTAKGLSLRIWAVLLAPINWDAPMQWWMPLAIAASMIGLLLLTVPGHTRTCRRTRLCLIAATCCAVLPAIHLALIGQSELGSRILYLAGAPFALLIGSLAPTGERRGIVILAVMLLGMAGILEHNLSAWHRAAIEARILCNNPTTQPPGTFEGVVLFQNGFAECVAATRSVK